MSISSGISRNISGKIAASITGRASLDDPLTLYNQTSIIIDTIPIGTRNIGTGGPSGDVTDIIGTAGNLSLGSINGLDTIVFGGDVIITAPGAILVSGKRTSYTVLRINTLGIIQYLVTNTTGAPTNRIRMTAANNLNFEAGGSAAVAGQPDTNIMVIVGQWNGDATSRFRFFCTTSGDTGLVDVGANAFSSAAIGGRFDGNITAQMDFCVHGDFPVEHTEEEIQFVLNILVTDWNITVS